MDEDAENREAFAETAVFLFYFKDVPDHRQAGKVTYPLDEILLLCLLAVWRGLRRLPTSPALAKRSSTSCAGSALAPLASSFHPVGRNSFE